MCFEIVYYAMMVRPDYEFSRIVYLGQSISQLWAVFGGVQINECFGQFTQQSF